MKMLSVWFLSMRRFRLDRKEDKIIKRRVIEQVAAYKYIPRHMHIISFLIMGYFVNKIVELRINVLFCISF